MDLDTGVLQALVAALIGGVGVALITAISNWLSKKVDVSEAREARLYKEAGEIRKELRSEIHSLELMITELQNNLDEWKRKYWDLYAKYLEVIAKIESDREERKNGQENKDEQA